MSTETQTKTLEKGKTYLFHPYQGIKRVQVWEDLKDGTWIGINQFTNRTIRVKVSDMVREDT